MRIQPKKNLGQNFLIDKNIQRKIIAACQFKTCDIVLEIGAGRGELTALLAPKVNKLLAVEIDPRLVPLLKDKFKGYANVRIINMDILKLNPNRYPAKYKNKIKVIGNIPYYITTPIIEHLLKYKDKIETVYLSVQKEFARRMCAGSDSKDYGSLSCFVQYFTEPKIIFTIKKNSFHPAPKVDSCFLRLEIRQIPLFGLKNERLFFKIIRAAFNQRRKTLRNSLKGIISPEKLRVFFQEHNINSDIRPEQLTLRDFAALTNT